MGDALCVGPYAVGRPYPELSLDDTPLQEQDHQVQLVMRMAVALAS